MAIQIDFLFFFLGISSLEKRAQATSNYTNNVSTEKLIVVVACPCVWHFLFLDTLVLLYGIELSRLGN